MALYNKGRRRKHELPIDPGVTPCENLEEQIASALKGAGHKANDHMIDCLAEYLRMMSQWTRAYNLTSVRDPVQMIPRHILDSLSIMPYLHGK
jgi:16S rRNA (guanine527-N7)-methyltransferase